MGFLRVFLAAAVVVSHAGLIFGIPVISGRTAVQCFFVISGFYMAMVLETKYLRLSQQPWRTFMQSRLARLFPVYLVTVVLSLVLVLFGGNIFVNGTPMRVPSFFDLPLVTWLPLAASNLAIVTQDWALFAGIDSFGYLFFTPDFRAVEQPAYEYLLVPQAWTVGLELVFYAVAPMLARRSNRILIGILAGSLALRLVLGLAGLYADPWSYRFFPFELSFFVAGMLAFRYRHLLVGRVPRHVPLALVTVTLLALPFLKVVPPAYAMAILAYPLAFALFIPAIFESTKKSRFDRWIGELSYPVYLTHILVLSLFASAGVNLSGPVAVVLSLVVGCVFVVLIDRPLEAARQRKLHTALNLRTPAREGTPMTVVPRS